MLDLILEVEAITVTDNLTVAGPSRQVEQNQLAMFSVCPKIHPKGA